MIRRLFKKTSEIKLGRWDHSINIEQEHIKSVWTNSDHCGDVICGKPDNIKKTLDSASNYKKEKTIKRSYNTLSNTDSVINKNSSNSTCCILLGFHDFCENCTLINN